MQDKQGKGKLGKTNYSNCRKVHIVCTKYCTAFLSLKAARLHYRLAWTAHLKIAQFGLQSGFLPEHRCLTSRCPAGISHVTVSQLNPISNSPHLWRTHLTQNKSGPFHLGFDPSPSQAIGAHVRWAPLIAHTCAAFPRRAAPSRIQLPLLDTPRDEPLSRTTQCSHSTHLQHLLEHLWRATSLSQHPLLKPCHQII